MSRITWYYADGANAQGPITWDALQAAARRGQLTEQGRVWSPGVDEWVPASDIPWLFRAPTEASEEPGPEDPEQGTEGVVVSPPPLKGTRFARARARSPLARFGLQSATPLRRALTFLIDSLVVVVLAALIGALIWAGMRKWNMSNTADTPGETVALAWFTLMLLYHVALESFTGTTVGKRAMGCRVVDAGGAIPFATRVVARGVVRLITAVAILIVVVYVVQQVIDEGSSNDIWWFLAAAPIALTSVILASTGERRALHDWAAGTWLVRRSSTPEAPPDAAGAR